MPRYLTSEEKQRKRSLILNNAVEMFDHMLFREITMSKLAKKCKIAKGTIFKYFDTKETLFSFILYSEYDNWVDEEKFALSRFDTFTKQQFIDFTRKRTHDIFANHPRLVRLTSMKRVILDKNINTELYAKLAQKFSCQMREIAKIAASKIPGASEEEMFEFYEAWHIAVVGSYNLGISRENMRKIEEAGIGDIHAIDVEKSALRSVTYYIKGIFCKKEN